MADLSPVKQAEGIINRLEFAKTAFSDGERNLIVNYAFKLGDMEKWDGRFSRDKKAWASEFPISEDIVHGINMNYALIVSSHPAVLNGFIGMFRREVMEQEKELSAGQEKVTSGHDVNPSAKRLCGC